MNITYEWYAFIIGLRSQNERWRSVKMCDSF